LFYDDQSAVPEFECTYWMRAKNAGGTSAFSPPVAGTRRQAVDGELLYEWNLYGEIDTSPAIADDGTIYVSVNMPVRDAPDAGRKVVAVQPDGSIRWQYLTGQATLTSPTVGADGTIYVGARGSLNTSPYPSPLLALNANGTLRWKMIADDAIETTPAIGQDGTIYVGSTLGTIYAVNPQGQLLWRTTWGVE
jgi:outer membrane protein assembly factor BamB